MISMFGTVLSNREDFYLLFTDNTTHLACCKFEHWLQNGTDKLIVYSSSFSELCSKMLILQYRRSCGSVLSYIFIMNNISMLLNVFLIELPNHKLVFKTDQRHMKGRMLVRITNTWLLKRFLHSSLASVSILFVYNGDLGATNVPLRYECRKTEKDIMKERRLIELRGDVLISALFKGPGVGLSVLFSAFQTFTSAVNT